MSGSGTQVPDPSGSEREREDRRNVLHSELRWMGIAGFTLLVLLGTIVGTSLTHGLHPPSNVEAIDSDRLHLEGEFVEENLGTEVTRDGTIFVRIVAAKFAFVPRCTPVPQGIPVRLRLASPDVIHGIIVNASNANTMVVPGYVSEVRTTFGGAGDRQMPCHEFCGMGHSQMWGLIRVVPLDQWPMGRTGRVACEDFPAPGQAPAELRP